MSITKLCRQALLLALLALILPAQSLAALGIGRIAVTPARVAAGSLNTFTFTYSADTASLVGQLLLDGPKGWSAPQATNAAVPGYVKLAPGTCSAATHIVRVVFRRIVIAASCARGQQFTLTYVGNASTQAADGYIFLAQTKPDAVKKPPPKRRGSKKKAAPKPSPARFLPLAPRKQPSVVVVGGHVVRLLATATSVATVNSAFGVLVRALDAYGNNASDFSGTVTLTTSDPQATIPAPYKYSAADLGGHTFSGFVLRTTGTQRVTATDDTGHTATTAPISVFP
jgi:hypothetical protein